MDSLFQKEWTSLKRKRAGGKGSEETPRFESRKIKKMGEGVLGVTKGRKVRKHGRVFPVLVLKGGDAWKGRGKEGLTGHEKMYP